MKLFSIMAALTVAIVTVASTPADAKKYHRVKYQRVHVNSTQAFVQSPMLPSERMVMTANEPFAAYKSGVTGTKKARRAVTHASDRKSVV